MSDKIFTIESSRAKGVDSQKARVLETLLNSDISFWVLDGDIYISLQDSDWSIVLKKNGKWDTE